MTPEELNTAIVEADAVNPLSILGEIRRTNLFPHLVARIRELEAQRPEVTIGESPMGNIELRYLGKSLGIYCESETKAREWAIQNGFRVKA